MFHRCTNQFSCVLQQFSSDMAENASTVCLAHLFTYQDFDEGTLGLAYVAPSKANALGGLCSKGKHQHLPCTAKCFTSVKATLPENFQQYSNLSCFYFI